jgi:hypothetical protein
MGPLGPFIHKPAEVRRASAPLGVESMLFSFVSEQKQNLKLSTKDLLALVSMKNAAKREM